MNKDELRKTLIQQSHQRAIAKDAGLSTVEIEAQRQMTLRQLNGKKRQASTRPPLQLPTRKPTVPTALKPCAHCGVNLRHTQPSGRTISYCKPCNKKITREKREAKNE